MFVLAKRGYLDSGVMMTVGLGRIIYREFIYFIL